MSATAEPDSAIRFMVSTRHAECDNVTDDEAKRAYRNRSRGSIV